MSILAKFIEYSKNPTIETNYVVKNKFWESLKLLSLSSMVGLTLSILIFSITSAFGYDQSRHLLNNIILTNPWWIVLFGSCIEAPFFEELQFRLWLRPNFRNVSVGLWMGLSGFLVIGSLFLFSGNEFVIPIFSFISFVIFAIWLLSSSKQNRKSIIPQKYFRYLYYFSILWFGFVHFFDYSDNSIWFLLPILILPQILGGFEYSFVRMHFGFKWSMLIHAISNFVILLPIVICREAAIEIYESISESKQIIPDLIYTLPLTNQFFYFSGVAISIIFILFGVYMSFLAIKEYLQYKKTQSYVE